jgi:hypothetical protein
MTQATSLEDVLRSCKVARGADTTHTSLRGGAYYVPAAKHDTLMDAYVERLQAGATDLALVERHRHIGPVLVDIDLRQSADASPQRLYAHDHVADF